MSETPLTAEEYKAERASALARQAWFAGYGYGLVSTPSTPISYLFEIVQQSNAVTAYCEWLSWQPEVYMSQIWLYIQANPKIVAALQTMETARDTLAKTAHSDTLS